ncbi:MAG TPA: hypothetical protein VL294_03545 [Pseudolysinimonas sp.]|jgi:hypothetical protein|nr:hypothetical protein [Pseudolysinimonas sp.]
MLCGVVLLAGCTPSAVPPASLIGATLDTLTAGPGADATLLVQDASPRVGATPSYSGDPDLDAAWRIVAICTSDPDVAKSAQIEVAVLPDDLVTAGVDAEVASGDFRDAVDCAGRPYHG